MDYRIPKNRVQVKILTKLNTDLSGYYIYLNKFSRFQTGEETLDEFLNSGKSFIPATNIKTEKTDFLNMNNIIYIIHEMEIDTESRMDLSILLINGDSIHVDQFEPLPSNHSRALDALNNDRSFIPYILDNKMIYINKNNIVRVTEA